MTLDVKMTGDGEGGLISGEILHDMAAFLIETNVGIDSMHKNVFNHNWSELSGLFATAVLKKEIVGVAIQ